MMDVSSLIDSTIVWMGLAGMLIWAWATLDTESNTVSTDSLSEPESSGHVEIPLRRAA